MTNDNTTKLAAQYMLRKGIANAFEVAKLSKRSRQIVRIWVPEHSEARAEFLKQQWAKAVKWAEKRA